MRKCSPEEKARAFLLPYWEEVKPKREAFHGNWPLPEASSGLLPGKVPDPSEHPTLHPPPQRGRSHRLETEGAFGITVTSASRSVR